MEYGSGSIKPEKLYLYQGFDPESVNFPPRNDIRAPMEVVNQRDAEILFMWKMYERDSREDLAQLGLWTAEAIRTLVDYYRSSQFSYSTIEKVDEISKFKGTVLDAGGSQSSLPNPQLPHNHKSSCYLDKPIECSVMTNKYSEGYPGARYYGGNEREVLAPRLSLVL